MANIEALIKEKIALLEDSPTRFTKAVAKSQRKIFNEITQLLNMLQRNSAGEIKITAQNIETIDVLIVELKKVVYGSDYVKAVDTLIDEMDQSAKISEKIVSEIKIHTTHTAVSTAILAAEKRHAIELLMGSSTIDKEFLFPIRTLLQDAVISGRSLKDLISDIRTFAEGDEERGGKLARYAQQIANDSFATADRSYTNALANEIGAEWYKYIGGVIDTTRPFCEERNRKIYHKKEIEAWGAGESCCDLEYPNDDGTWAGMAVETDEKTIFIWAGGYNCKHSIIPVDIASVPPDVIERNIENGNYKPDKNTEEETEE